MKGIVKKLCDIDGIAIDEADAAAQADQMQLFMNVGSVSGIFGNMKKIAEISETAPERTEGEAVPAASEDIVFDRVSFAYTPEQDVLHDVSLRIPAGKATAIIGGNGAGKSTLFKLLTRLYEPKSGAIRFGGNNIADFALTGWRDRFAYVFQKDPLIGGTVRENITYGLDREVSEEELIAAAKKANCYDCIMAKPGGFDEDVGLGGSNFSGGQAQCISIARAMLRDADYLLLDEATSNLDVVSSSCWRAAFGPLWSPAEKTEHGSSERDTPTTARHFPSRCRTRPARATASTRSSSPDLWRAGPWSAAPSMPLQQLPSLLVRLARVQSSRPAQKRSSSF